MFQTLGERLTQRQRIELTVPSLKQAAVLVPLYRDQDQRLGIVFIQRTSHMSHHRGQISFPGGAMQAEDLDLEATALRETKEEIGLPPQVVRLLGRLDDVQTHSSQFRITPIVGEVPSRYPYSINPNEVARIITSPINDLNCRQAARGREYWIDRTCVWGATARILAKLLTLLE
jgi:8-oxo-dGTP pyrophosphatase MutT (NUDIX family)